MKMKLAILEPDYGYINKIVSVFNTKYSDVEIYSFTDKEIAMVELIKNKIDVLVANELFDFEDQEIPDYCGFAYFVENIGIDTTKGHQAICKYQKVDLIYKQILSIYAEKANRSFNKFGNENVKILGYVSPCGGVGSSSMAAACAVYMAKRSKKVLYLNLEKLGSADVFFDGEGQFDLSDIIFALKSKKNNISIKLESCVKESSYGVYFYSASDIALDMLELNKEDVLKLFTELKLSGEYDYIIVDMDFSMESDYLEIYRNMNKVIWVNDGSEISNTKVFRAYNALKIMEESQKDKVLDRLVLSYNKFSSKTSKELDGIDVENIGGAQKFEYATAKQVVEQLSSKTLFDKLM